MDTAAINPPTEESIAERFVQILKQGKTFLIKSVLLFLVLCRKEIYRGRCFQFFSTHSKRYSNMSTVVSNLRSLDFNPAS